MAGLETVTPVDFTQIPEQAGFNPGDYIVFVRTTNGASSWCKVPQSKVTALAIVQPWAANTDYEVNTLISNDQVLYQVETAFTSGTDFDDSNLSQITPNLTYTEAGGLSLAAPDIDSPLLSGSLSSLVVNLSDISPTIDPSNGSIFFLSLNNSSTTISISPLNASTQEKCFMFTLVLRQNSANSEVVWSTNISWTQGNTAPDIPATVGDYLVIEFFSFDQGKTWVATVGPKGPKGDAGDTTVVTPTTPTTPTQSTNTDTGPSQAYLFFMGQL